MHEEDPSAHAHKPSSPMSLNQTGAFHSACVQTTDRPTDRLANLISGRRHSLSSLSVSLGLERSGRRRRERSRRRRKRDRSRRRRRHPVIIPVAASMANNNQLVSCCLFVATALQLTLLQLILIIPNSHVLAASIDAGRFGLFGGQDVKCVVGEPIDLEDWAKVLWPQFKVNVECYFCFCSDGIAKCDRNDNCVPKHSRQNSTTLSKQPTTTSAPSTTPTPALTFTFTSTNTQPPPETTTTSATHEAQTDTLIKLQSQQEREKKRYNAQRKPNKPPPKPRPISTSTTTTTPTTTTTARPQPKMFSIPEGAINWNNTIRRGLTTFEMGVGGGIKTRHDEINHAVVAAPVLGMSPEQILDRRDRLLQKIRDRTTTTTTTTTTTAKPSIHRPGMGPTPPTTTLITTTTTTIWPSEDGPGLLLHEEMETDVWLILEFIIAFFLLLLLILLISLLRR